MPVTAAVIAGGASVVSGLFGSHASKNAAKTQASATNAALAEQKRIFDIKQAQAAPYIKSGEAALGRLNDMTKYQVHQTLPPAYGREAAYNAPVQTWQQAQNQPAPAPPSPTPAPAPGPNPQPQPAPGGGEPMAQFQAPTGQIGTFPERMAAQLIARGARRIS